MEKDTHTSLEEIEKKVELKKEKARDLELIPLVLNVYFEVFAKGRKITQNYKGIISNFEVTHSYSYRKLWSNPLIPNLKGKDRYCSFEIGGNKYTIYFYQISPDWFDKLFHIEDQYVEIGVFKGKVSQSRKSLSEEVFAIRYKDFSYTERANLDKDGRSRPMIIEKSGRLIKPMKDVTIDAFTEGKWIDDFKKIKEIIDIEKNDLKQKNLELKQISENKRIEQLKKDFR